MSDHKRGCPGREYVCTCGHDERSEWKPIETSPKDGTHFLAVCVDLVDEYDENDRLLERGKREEYVCVAYHIEWLGGTVQFPFNGGIVQNRRFTHWMPLPEAPK